MKDDFDTWSELKKKIDSISDVINEFPKEGEVWMCHVGRNVGYEQNGVGNNFSRPILIIKKFNNRMFWGASLSTKQKPYDFYYNFTDPNSDKVSVILAQLKLVSTKRFIRNMYTISPNDFSEIKNSLIKFLE